MIGPCGEQLETGVCLGRWPTTLEAGYRDSEYNFWVGVFASSATPRNVVDRLHRETLNALQTPTVKEKLMQLGADPMVMTPTEFDAHVREEIMLNARLVKAAGIRAN